MTQRERVLAGGVGAIMLILALQWGFGKYRAAMQARETRLFTLNDQISNRQLKQFEGALAERRMGEYVTRSLPSDLERAQFAYNQFLLGLVSEAGLAGASAKPVTMNTAPGPYTQLNFNVSGSGDLKQLVELLYRFHRQNYLHRIQSLTVRKVRGQLSIDMDVQALALDAAPPQAPPPTEPAPRVAETIDFYLEPILNRNPLAPPNRPPSFAAERSAEAVVGKEFTYVARFEDPDEGQQLRYSLVGDPPEGVTLDEESGALQITPEEVGKIDLTLRATDDGWPAKKSEEQIVINVVEPPEEEPEPAAFDEAKQTVLTALTQSKGEWTAWLHVRTSGETLYLREGDTFEVGQLSGKVVEVNSSYAVLEYEGDRFVLRHDVTLAEAVQSSKL